MERYFTYINMFIVIFILGILALGSSKKEEDPIYFNKWNQERFHPNTPCQNLDALDSVSEIMHWEIIDDTLRIYTQQDSMRDEIERIKYIRSLDPEGWE